MCVRTRFGNTLSGPWVQRGVCTQDAEARGHRAPPEEVFLEGKSSHSCFIHSTAADCGAIVNHATLQTPACLRMDAHARGSLGDVLGAGPLAHGAGGHEVFHRSDSNFYPHQQWIKVLLALYLAITQYCQPFLLAILVDFSLWVKFTSP